MHMHYVQIEKYQFDFFFFSNSDMDLTIQEDMIRTIKAIMKERRKKKKYTACTQRKLVKIR